MCGFVDVFFFFKQKTAYEMRISDWSSDVCSSDLHAFEQRLEIALAKAVIALALDEFEEHQADLCFGKDLEQQARLPASRGPIEQDAARLQCLDILAVRSEEHTSELQSLMRISYAVFCLQKKTKYKQDIQYYTND